HTHTQTHTKTHTHTDTKTHTHTNTHTHSVQCSGDPEALGKSRCDLRTTIRDGKREYRDKLESTYLSSDPRRMWGGLRNITGYKGRNSSDDQPAASLPDDLNTFYARFEATTPLPSAKLAEDRDDCTLSLTVADVRRELQRVNRWSSWQRPQGVRRPASGGIHLHIQ